MEINAWLDREGAAPSRASADLCLTSVKSKMVNRGGGWILFWDGICCRLCIFRRVGDFPRGTGDEGRLEEVSRMGF